MPTLTDHDLIAGIRLHDRAAFGELYDRFAPRVFGLLNKLLGDRSEAEDVLQEVFLHVWRNADRYDPNLSQPLVWLMLVARGRAVDALRRRASQSSLPRRAANGAVHPAVSAPDLMPNHRDESRSMGAAMAALPADQSDAIDLAYHGGLTCAQIADLRQVPVGTVKTRIRLGMMKLRDAMSSGARTLRGSEATT